MRNMQISSGLYFIRRLVNHNVKDLPVSLISSVKRASSYSSRVFFSMALFSPPEMLETKIMEGLILEWLNNAVEDIREAIAHFTAKCKYTQHIYTLCKVLEENVHSVKTSELVGVYADALRRDCSDGVQLRKNASLRAKIGEVLYKLSGWFSDDQNLYREMLLCSFSVYPTTTLMTNICDTWILCRVTTSDEQTCRCARKLHGKELCENCGLFGRTLPLKPFRAKFLEADMREALTQSYLDLSTKDCTNLARVLYKLRLLSGLTWETKPSHMSSLVDWHLSSLNEILSRKQK